MRGIMVKLQGDAAQRLVAWSGSWKAGLCKAGSVESWGWDHGSQIAANPKGDRRNYKQIHIPTLVFGPERTEVP